MTKVWRRIRLLPCAVLLEKLLEPLTFAKPSVPSGDLHVFHNMVRLFNFCSLFLKIPSRHILSHVRNTLLSNVCPSKYCRSHLRRMSIPSSLYWELRTHWICKHGDISGLTPQTHHHCRSSFPLFGRFQLAQPNKPHVLYHVVQMILIFMFRNYLESTSDFVSALWPSRTTFIELVKQLVHTLTAVKSPYEQNT